MSAENSLQKRESELQQSELFRMAVDDAVDAVFCINRRGRFIYANLAAQEYLGYSSEELRDMNIRQIDCNCGDDLRASQWEKARKLKKFTFESCHLTKTGENVPVELKVSHLEQEGSDIYCAFISNIAERKMTEKLLLENEDNLRKTLDATSDGVWDHNLKTGEIYYGSKFASVLGFSKEDLRTGKISWEALLHPEDKEKTIQALHDYLDGETESYEVVFRLKNSADQYLWIYARGRIIEYDTDGTPLRFVCAHTDITSQKTMEHSLQKSTEETKLFAYSVAHDLKNPALAVRGLAVRFGAKIFELNENRKRMYCDRIIESAEQIVELIEKINDYISSKETSPFFEDVPLKEVVHASRNEFAAQLQYRSISWRGVTENPIIRMDRMAMSRVLRNLIENSLKYGGPGLSKITIGYRNTPGYHVISYRDNGVGMNLQDCERIFQPFERKEGAAEQSGSGLGLAIVKEIASRHNGEVWIEPNNKRGVHFCFAISKNL